MSDSKFDYKKALGYNLSTTFHALGGLLTKNLNEAKIDLTQAQAKTLMYLGKHEGAKQQNLADLMQKEKPAITKMLDYLGNKGLVTRVEDESDRRNKLLYLTDEGKKVRKSLFPVIAKTHMVAQEGIGKEEFENFLLTMNKIKTNITYNLDKNLPF